MTATINHLRAVIMTGPDQLRSQCSQYKTQLGLTRFLVARRPGPDLHDPNTATVFVAGVLARQWLELHERRTTLSAQIEIIVETIAPTLNQHYGVGPITSAQLLVCAGDNPDRLRSASGFVALCGASPIPASSGNTDRHRLNRSGNRDANSALWRITMTRMASDPRTRLYVQRRTAEGKTKKEIIRCLKVYIARELFPIIVSALTPPPPRSPGWLDPTLHPTTVS